ncbi:MAG: PAS domain S-box protein [Armatimonadia bacterium]|nr:PAS domain S-box protein [Armatimonadia bacterium]
MKTGVKIVIYSVFLGLCIWVVDAVFYFRFFADTTFVGALLTEVPVHKLYLRGLVLLSLVVFGWIIGSATAREQKAEQSMRKVAHRLDLILKSTHEGVFGVDLEGRFTFANEAAASLLGYASDDLMGRPVHELIHHTRPDGAPYPHEECPILHPSRMRTGVRVTGEVFWTADGESIPVHYSAMPIEEDDSPLGTVVVFRAISADEIAREELERLRRLSQLILKWAGEGIFGIDMNGRITFANPAAAVMLGYEAEEMVGEDAHSLLQHTRADGTPHPQNQSLIYAAFEDDDVYHVSDELFWREDDDSFPVEYTATPLRESGELVGAVVVFKDITERKLAEKDLRNTLDELARSNRELEMFAYVVSHDLQEPLRMVQSYVKLLERRYADALDEDAHEFIQFAVDGTMRMQGMIEDLLRYSRVGSRGAEFAHSDLNEVLDEALTNLTATIKESDAEVESGDLPSLMVDRGQMVQLFQNLISNAIKFSGDAPPRISLRAESRNGSWVIAVKDNGIGIAEEQMERIFAIFQRLHSPDEYSGTGIGLAICKKIVERHNGSIWVESEPGEGSTFFVSLPSHSRASIVS